MQVAVPDINNNQEKMESEVSNLHEPADLPETGLNRQQRRAREKAGKLDLIKEIASLRARINQMNRDMATTIISTSKRIASNVLTTQLFPIVDATLKEDFGFSDERIKKFNDIYTERAKAKLAEETKDEKAPKSEFMDKQEDEVQEVASGKEEVVSK